MNFVSKKKYPLVLILWKIYFWFYVALHVDVYLKKIIDFLIMYLPINLDFFYSHHIETMWVGTYHSRAQPSYLHVDCKPCWWKNIGDNNSLGLKTVEMLNMLRLLLIETKFGVEQWMEILWQYWMSPTRQHLVICEYCFEKMSSLLKNNIIMLKIAKISNS